MTGKAQAASVARQLSKTKKQSLPATRQLLNLLFVEFSHDPDFIRNVGLILLRDVEYTLAGFIFEGLTKSHPKYAPTFNDLGLVLGLFGYGERATDAFRKAIDFAPKLKEARANLAFTVHYFGEPGRPEI